MQIKSIKNLSLVGLLWMSAAVAESQEYAAIQRKDAAMGHYARARTMLVEALAEFEQARKIARPDMLIDPEEWRISLISRAEELNRILDPKPRVTREGVRFQANPLLIRRERERTPRPDEMAKDNNYQGEEERRTQKKVARASMDYGAGDKIQLDKKQIQPETKSLTPADRIIRDEVKRDAEEAITGSSATAVPVAPEVTAPRVIESEEITTNGSAVVNSGAAKQVVPESKTEVDNTPETVDEDAVSKVVDEIVKERLNAGAGGGK